MVKVVLNVGTGTAIKKDKNKNDAIGERLAKITGQKGSSQGRQTINCIFSKFAKVTRLE